MANIKSAKKRILVSQKRADRNKSIRSKVKTAIKKVEVAIEANDKTHCEQLFLKLIKLPKKVFIIRTTQQEKYPA